jgi:gamma-tubulin complex component 3
MLEYSHGEIGWDVFTLEYKIDAPINTVIDSDCIVKYLKLFNFLWQLKRVEVTLTKAWMRLAGARRSLLRVPGKSYPLFSLSRDKTYICTELEHEWHRVRTTMSEMIHFVRQLQAYCNVEVIECSWKALMDFFDKKEGDLDAMIDAHRTYLDRMVKKILLIIPKTGKQVSL